MEASNESQQQLLAVIVVSRHRRAKEKDPNEATRMGWFGKKKSRDESDYTDVESANEHLPIAVAIYPVAQDPPMVAAAPIAPSAPAEYQVKEQAARLMKAPEDPGPTTAKVLPNFAVMTRHPMALTPCMHCGTNSRTRVVTSPNWITWCVVALLLFLFWPLFWMPLVFMNSRLSEHFCNHCSAKIGSIHPCEDCCVKHR